MTELEQWIAAGVVSLVLLGWHLYRGYKTQAERCTKDQHWLC